MGVYYGNTNNNWNYMCNNILHIQKTNDSSSSQPLNDGVKAEIDEALEQVFLFRKDNQFWE